MPSDLTPLSYAELDILSSYVELSKKLTHNQSAPLDPLVIERLLLTVYKGVRAEFAGEGNPSSARRSSDLLDHVRWKHLRDQINAMPDDSARITLHRLINAAAAPGAMLERLPTPEQASYDLEAAQGAALAAVRAQLEADCRGVHTFIDGVCRCGRKE